MEQRTKGQIVIELLVAFGLAAILLPALLTSLIASRNGKVQQEQRILAVGLLREGEEAVRSVRDVGWDRISTNGVYYPRIVGSNWTLTTDVTYRVVGDFTRTIDIADITPTDPSLKKITITVSWGSTIPSSTVSTMYLTRWKNTSLTDSGSVQPINQGFGDWCKPSLAFTNINLNRQGHPTSLSAKETPNAIDGNRVLAGTGANSSGPAFSNLKLLGDTPPVVTNLGDYNGSPSQVKVNGLIGDDHYAFIATDNKGVEFLDLTTNPISKIGSFNPSGMKNVNDVYVVGNTGYAVTTDKFYIFGISPDRKTSTPSASLALANGAKVVVDPSSRYAYVPNPDSTGELKIVDVHTYLTRTPANLVSGDIRNVDIDSGAGRAVFINASATRAYLATAESSTKPEFFIVNITDPTNPSVFADSGTDKATYDTNGMDPYGVTIVTDNRAIIVGCGEACSKTGNEYQVFSVADDKVTFCPNHTLGTDYLNIDTGVYAVSSLKQTNNHAYSYIATGDAGAELRIIEGGPGGGGNGSNGMFESATLPSPDPGHDVVFNSFTATVDPYLSYKISIKPGVGGSCSGVTFADSDFTSFIPGPLPLGTLGAGYANPGECMRYRVYDSGDSTKAFAITFNYSP